MIRMFLAAFAAVLVVPTAALACGGKAKTTMASAGASGCGPQQASMSYLAGDGTACHGSATMAKPTVKKIDVQQLVALKDGKTKVTPVDANGTATRAKMGVIPGAILLTSVSQFDPAKELPADKSQKLVFYCANTQCTASTTAAEKALDAGYTDVNVLPEGIAGWRASGQGTSSVPRS